MIEFHNTGYGRKFFEHDLPSLIRAIEKVGRELKIFNQTMSSIDVVEKLVDIKIDEVIERAKGDLDHAGDI
jgi:hypothetical protein